MSTIRRTIFAFSGMIDSQADTRTSFDLTRHALSLARPGVDLRVCYVPTAVGDSPAAW